MGSTAKGLISGFVCRLCSKMNRYVVLIYGAHGRKMRLADKINAYLPVTISKNDPLPKTVCPKCLDCLERHSKMIEMISQAETKFRTERIYSTLAKPSCKTVNNNANNTENDIDSDEGETACDEVETQPINS